MGEKNQLQSEPTIKDNNTFCSLLGVWQCCDLNIYSDMQM